MEVQFRQAQANLSVMTYMLNSTCIDTVGKYPRTLGVARGGDVPPEVEQELVLSRMTHTPPRLKQRRSADTALKQHRGLFLSCGNLPPGLSALHERDIPERLWGESPHEQGCALDSAADRSQDMSEEDKQAPVRRQDRHEDTVSNTLDDHAGNRGGRQIRACKTGVQTQSGSGDTDSLQEDNLSAVGRSEDNPEADSEVRPSVVNGGNF